MKTLAFLFLSLLMGCCAAEPVPTKWRCVADVNQDSQCKVISCDEIGSVCKRGKYRIMTIYPTKQIYVYSTDPPTDFKRCKEAVKED